MEIYIAIGNVTGIAPGIYKYDSEEHSITQTFPGDIREGLSAASLNQSMLIDAPITIIYTAVYSRITERYGDRGRERYIYMEIGHSSQNIYLQAESLGLSTCAIGAFTESQLIRLLRLPPEEEPLYLMPVGHP